MMIPSTTLLGARLRAARLHRNLTQQDVAHAAGCSIQTISNLETGIREGRLGTMIALADALGVSIDDLVAGLPDVRDEAMRKAWTGLAVAA
jgi:transcriptional regulator with XRE-family HTH domain